MEEYIKKSEAVDVIVKYPYNISGKTATAIKMIEDLPSADVVPKSEVEKLVQDGIRLGQENETLKDNNEHLAVILEETKAEVERLQAKKDALIKNYAECMKDYASEIFAEIEKIATSEGAYDYVSIQEIAELKKKYTEGEDKPAATEEKYFSPEDVRKMTPQEVREKYTAIRKSMERW